MDKAIIPDTTVDQNDKGISLYQWGVFMICLLANVSAGLVSTIASVYLPVISVDLVGIEASTDVSTYISALYLVGWATGGLFWGAVSDRWGRSKTLSLCLACVGLWTILVSFAHLWELVVLFRLMGGFSVGGILVLTMTLLSELWPAASRSQIMGIVSIGFPVGIFSSGLVNTLLGDWRQAFLVGVIPLILGLYGFFKINESGQWLAQRENKSQHVEKGFKPPGLFYGAMIFGAMLLVLWSIFSWMPTWVQSILPDSDGQTERGAVMMILGFGGIIGGMLSGWTARLLGERRAMLICFAGVFCMSLFLFGFQREFTVWVYVGAVFLSFFFGMSQGLLSFYIPQLFEVAVRARATAFCFNAGRFVTALAVFTLGMLVSLFGGYGNALLGFSLLLIPGFLFVLLSKPYQSKTSNYATYPSKK